MWCLKGDFTKLTVTACGGQTMVQQQKETWEELGRGASKIQVKSHGIVDQGGGRGDGEK